LTSFLSKPWRQTKYAATPIRINKSVQTGPKIQFGGLSAGLAKELYQPFIDGIVNNDPIIPIICGIIKAMINFNELFNFIFLKFLNETLII